CQFRLALSPLPLSNFLISGPLYIPLPIETFFLFSLKLLQHLLLLFPGLPFLKESGSEKHQLHSSGSDGSPCPRWLLQKLELSQLPQNGKDYGINDKDYVDSAICELVESISCGVLRTLQIRSLYMGL
ncbi:unnamed protein product, partial [Timema podura]|nr:unnamed protein product [Timema podura]